MNWLAHALLSTPEPEFRLGNLTADLVRGRDRESLGETYLRGIRCHQAIDAFTDSHPLVHRSRARISTTYGHLTGILVDVFYDHFLSLDWERYCPVSLDTFTRELYAQLRACPLELPEEARHAVERAVTLDVLGSYRRLEGITMALHRVSERLTARLGRPFDLTPAVQEMTGNFTGMAEDFSGFFPELQGHIAPWLVMQESE